MVDYRVSETDANRVIDGTRAQAGEFEQLVTDLRTAVEGTVAQCQSTLIAGALQEVHDAYLAPVATMAHWRSTNIVNEGQKMVNALIDGDVAMGVDARNQIDDVPSSWEDAQ
jgi:hypothetical protein